MTPREPPREHPSFKETSFRILNPVDGYGRGVQQKGSKPTISGSGIFFNNWGRLIMIYHDFPGNVFFLGCSLKISEIPSFWGLPPGLAGAPCACWCPPAVPHEACMPPTHPYGSQTWPGARLGPTLGAPLGLSALKWLIMMSCCRHMLQYYFQMKNNVSLVLWPCKGIHVGGLYAQY